MNRRETIDASVREHAAERRRSEGAHPEVEELAAYHEGELGEEAQERIRDHLALCDECSSLVLDLAGFSELEPPSEAHRLSAEDVQARKAELLARIRAGEKPGAKLLEFTPRPEPANAARRASIPVWYHGLAAALLTATVGLAFWTISLRQQIDAGAVSSSAPKLNTDVESLLPVDDLLRGSPRAQAVSFSPDRDLVLSLTYLKTDSYPDYRLELYDGTDGRLLRAADGLQRQADGLFTLTFPRKLLARGRSFRLKVLGLGTGEPEPLAEYVFSVEDVRSPGSP